MYYRWVWMFELVKELWVTCLCDSTSSCKLTVRCCPPPSPLSVRPRQVAIVGCVSWFRHDQQNWLLWRICRKCDYKYRILKLMQQNKFCTSFLSVRILNTLTILWPIRCWWKAVDGSVRSVSRIDCRLIDNVVFICFDILIWLCLERIYKRDAMVPD